VRVVMTIVVAGGVEVGIEKTGGLNKVNVGL
jgi:hypothetical protein